MQFRAQPLVETPNYDASGSSQNHYSCDTPLPAFLIVHEHAVVSDNHRG